MPRAHAPASTRSGWWRRRWSSSRSGGRRRRPEELRAVYRLDPALTRPMPEQVAVVDDLLTSRAHFRAAQEVLPRRWPGRVVIGIFLARTVR